MNAKTKPAANPKPTVSNLLPILNLTLIFAMVLSLSACGGQGGGNTTAASTAQAVDGQTAVPDNYFTITGDEYGLMTPNFYYSSDAPSSWTIQAAVADGVHDEEFKSIVRIDVPKAAPPVVTETGKSFSVEAGGAYEKFPGSIFVFNGRRSVLKKVEQGTISFAPGSPASGDVEGAFDVMLTDYDSTRTPAPRYRITGMFRFRLGTSGPANPLPASVWPAQGKEAYDGLCSTCHALGEYDSVREIASDLSQRGGELPLVYASVGAHENVNADASTMRALGVFLNAW